MTPTPSPETLDRVIGIVELYTLARRITANSALRQDLGIDDMDRMGIACELSSTFSVDASDHEVVEWDTAEDIARTVEWHQRSRAA